MNLVPASTALHQVACVPAKAMRGNHGGSFKLERLSVAYSSNEVLALQWSLCFEV